MLSGDRRRQRLAALGPQGGRQGRAPGGEAEVASWTEEQAPARRATAPWRAASRNRGRRRAGRRVGPGRPATPSSRCRSTTPPCGSRRRRDLRRLPQRRHRRHQHRPPPQGRQPGLDRTGLQMTIADCDDDCRLRLATHRHRNRSRSQSHRNRNDDVARRPGGHSAARPGRIPGHRPRAARRAPEASIGASPIRIPRRPAWPCRGSTSTSARGASSSSARARSASSSRSPPAERSAVDPAASSPTPSRAWSSPPVSSRRRKCSTRRDRANLPRLKTRAATPLVMARLSAALDVYLAPRAVVHGVLMDILGLGVLIIGESGIGKSECALDLVVRGHRLVADDAVELRARADAYLMGSCPELTRHHMEIRGLGLINVQDLFGVASTRTLEARRARRAARALGSDARVRSARPRRGAPRDARRPRADAADAGGAGTQPRHPGGSGGAEPAAAQRRA